MDEQEILQDQTQQTPETQQPAPDDLRRELETLRRETQQRRLLEEARAALEERGVDPRFADFVLGEDSAATRRRAEQFERQFSETLRQQLARRLPQGEPRDFAAQPAGSRRRGVRKL